MGPLPFLSPADALERKKERGPMRYGGGGLVAYARPSTVFIYGGHRSVTSPPNYFFSITENICIDETLPSK